MRVAYLLLGIAFLDELVFGAVEAAWPLIRDDLALTYAQIGILLGIPHIFGSLLEIPFGILADMGGKTSIRRIIALTGGVGFVLACLLTASSHSFVLLLLAFMLFSPSSGGFVGMSQAALMDIDPNRHEQNMARWNLAGSLGVVAGPLLLSAALALGAGWRVSYVVFAVLAALMLAAVWGYPFPRAGRPGEDEEEDQPASTFGEGVKNAITALGRAEVLRWLVLLTLSDLMLDVLLGYLALYMVDAGQFTPAQAGIAVGVWAGVGLLGDAAMVPLLERIDGVRYLRVSAALELVLFVAFLLVSGLVPKLILLGVLGFCNAGWYAILQARVYTALPGQTGIALTLSTAFYLVGGLMPLGIGLIAERFSLALAMWLLLAGPIALLIGLPRQTWLPPD